MLLPHLGRQAQDEVARVELPLRVLGQLVDRHFLGRSLRRQQEARIPAG